MIPVAPGDLLDKLTILEIKLERITEPEKLRNVQAEHALLAMAASRNIPQTENITSLRAALKSVNEQLWEIEDDIRLCERQQNFGDHFIALARSVYRKNDERASFKRLINMSLNSTILEEKSYHAY
jgi:hypothetical protein